MARTAAPTIQTITGRPAGPDADAATIWMQVRPTTWLGMGARPQNAMRLPDGLNVDIYRGAGTRKAKLVIKLNALDLYDVEIGCMNMRTLDWVPLAQTLDVYAEDLDEVIRDLYDQVAH